MGSRGGTPPGISPRPPRGPRKLPPRAALAVGERTLGALALQELADRAADGARRLEQPLVGLAQRAAGESEHADAIAFGDDRERECALDAGRRHQLLHFDARIVGGVGGPHRVAALQDAAGEALSRPESDGARSLHESLDRRVGNGPAVLEAQQPGGLVDREMAAADPALAVADGAQHRLDAAARVLRLRQRPDDLVLQAQQLIVLYAPGDVPGDAAISLEPPVRVEDRLAAHAHVS